MAKKIRRYKIIEKHMELIKEGKFLQARTLLKLLAVGRISVSIGNDEGYEMELWCEKIGCHISYSRDYYRATIFA